MELTQILAWAGIFFGSGAGIYVVIQTILNKKLRSPADRQSEIEFGVGLLKTQIEKAERDASRWLEVEQYLREELRRTETDKDKLQNLLKIANEQINELIVERNNLQLRLAQLAAKVARGEKIHMSDITGDTDPVPVLDEDTMGSAFLIGRSV